MRPNLVHPIWVTVDKIDKTQTVYDTDAREPIRSAAHPVTVRIQAQHQPSGARALEVFPQGASDNVTGYILVQRADLTRLSWEPKRGDRITQIGIQVMSNYVVGTQPAAHYPDQSGYSLLRVFYADRNPSTTPSPLS